MHRLSVAEIADLVDELDDSDADPDYMEQGQDVDSSASDQENDDNSLPLGLETKSTRVGPEYQVYMEPPVERPEADTDKDSGKKKIMIFFIVADLKQSDPDLAR